MNNGQTLRGVATINFYAADHDAAKKWYTEFLGIEPYFNVPGYAEFRIGDFQQELGIVDSRYVQNRVGSEPAGATIYWHVDDLQTVLDNLLAKGAHIHESITERGHGFVTASVVDPFGNILGIMSNPHYLDIFQSTQLAKTT